MVKNLNIILRNSKLKPFQWYYIQYENYPPYNNWLILMQLNNNIILKIIFGLSYNKIFSQTKSTFS